MNADHIPPMSFTATLVARLPLLVLICLLPFLSVGTRAATVDMGFDPDVDRDVLALALQSDGKILIGGRFTAIDGVATRRVARLNSDGSLDTAFNPPEMLGVVYALAVQPDGKILVGGGCAIRVPDGGYRYGLARLNSNGSLDAAFNAGTDSAGQVDAIALQRDGKIVVGGLFTSVGGVSRSNIARVNPDGSVDTTFNPGTDGEVRALAVQVDGRIVVTGSFTTLGGAGRTRVGRLWPGGSLDTTFNPACDASVHSVALQADGKILIGGEFGSAGGQPRSRLARLNADGSLDTGFRADADSYVFAIAIAADGKILVAGFFFSIGGASRQALARLDQLDGSVDPTFDHIVSCDVQAMVIQQDGKIILGGSVCGVDLIERNRIARLNPDGSLERTFDAVVSRGNAVYAVATQPDGKILLGGDFTQIETTKAELGLKTQTETRNRIARLNADGSLDTAFDPNIPTAYEYVLAIAVQPNGRILVGGNFSSIAGGARNNIARLFPNGALDTAFNPSAGDFVTAIAVQPNGQIIIGGNFTTVSGVTRNHIARLNSDGSLDASFNPNADHEVVAIALQTDGKILVGGGFSSIGGGTRARIARLNADGSLDVSFNAQNADDWVYGIAVRQDGKIMAVGNFSSIGGGTRDRVARLNSDGSLDAAFNAGANDRVYAIALQPDGKAVIAGRFTAVSGQTRRFVARLNSGGALDGTFNPGAGGVVQTVTIQKDGKVLVGGAFTELGGQTRYRFGRLTETGVVYQQLRVAPDGRALFWDRNGSGPELTWTTFESSTNGSTWTLLGRGSQTPGRWQLTGLNLPFNQSFYIRARGYYSNSSSCSLLEATQMFRLVLRPPVMVSHPVSVTVNEGTSVSFVSIADGYPTPAINWHVNAGSGWSQIPGATATTYTHTALGSEDNHQYRAYFTNSSGSAFSDVAILRVVKNQTITIEPHAPASAVYGTSFTVAATATSGLGVEITSAGVCTGSGTGSATMTMTSGTGTCSVLYRQPGNSAYNPAPEVTESTTAAKAAQTISFPPLADKIMGDPPFAVSATASSSLSVAFSSLTLSVCTISGATVTMVAPGTCDVRATQPGNASFTAAAPVNRSFLVRVNSNPAGGADLYVIRSGETLTVAAPGVLSNDTDADGDSLTAVLSTGPAQGTGFSLTPDGGFTYTHDGVSSDDDGFTYRARDARGAESDVVTVTLALTGRIYVDAGAPAGGDGRSWATAYEYLQDGLAHAGPGDEIWVAEGAYYPDEGAGTTDNDPGQSFVMKPGVKIYGGFVGTEEDLSERLDWNAHKSILSGDISQDDVDTDGNLIAERAADDIRGVNSDRVVVAENLDATACLDGFTVTAGSAAAMGGGIFAHSSSAGFFNLDVRGNQAVEAGGGMAVRTASPRIENVLFDGNRAHEGSRPSGGGLAAIDGGSPALVGVSFTNNQAHFGGGISLASGVSLVISNGTFLGNEAWQGGGVDAAGGALDIINGVFLGNKAERPGYSDAMGGGLSSGDGSQTTLLNVTFSGNQADRGGAIANRTPGGPASVVLTNCILWNDASSDAAAPDEIFEVDGAVTTVSYSDIAGGFGGVENIDADPLFLIPVPAAAPTTAGDLRLRSGSPAIDTGTDAGAPAADLVGVTRPFDGDGIGGARCDMGAYEYSTFQVAAAAGAHGSLDASTPSPQSIGAGASITFTFFADPNYHVATVSGCGGTPYTNGLNSVSTLTYTTGPVIAGCTVSATFALNAYTLAYTPGPDGTVVGPTPQTVSHGGSGAAVTAAPNSGHRFTGWSDGSTANPRTDADVAADILVTASFGAMGVSWSDPAPITYGTPLTGLQLNASASVPGSFAYQPGLGDVLGAGGHLLSATFTPDDLLNNTIATTSATLMVNQATPTITWSTPAAILYGTSLDGTQLNATAEVPGTFAYSPPPGAVLSAGSHSLLVTFTPSDTDNLTSAVASVTLVVNQVTALVSWADPAPITYGTALDATQQNATASVPGIFDYSPPAGTILGAGSHTLRVAFTPADSTNFGGASASVTLVVYGTGASITWVEPAPINYLTALSETQLNATANVPGVFAYSPDFGTILPAGSHTLNVTFTPTDSDNYLSAEASVSLLVDQANPAITWPHPAAIVSGTALSAIHLNATADVPGIFEYSPPAGTVLAPGTHTLTVTFIPADPANFANATTSVTILVEQEELDAAVPTLTDWGLLALMTLLAFMGITRLRRAQQFPAVR